MRRDGRLAHAGNGREIAGTQLLYRLAKRVGMARPHDVGGVPCALAVRRRGVPLAMLLAPIVLVTLVAATTYGSVRLRMAAEIPLAVLGAAGLIELRNRFARESGAEPRPRPPGPSSPA